MHLKQAKFCEVLKPTGVEQVSPMEETHDSFNCSDLSCKDHLCQSHETTLDDVVSTAELRGGGGEVIN